MKDLLVSRKFWATVITLIVVIVMTLSVKLANFELDSENAAGLVVVAVSYIIGVAVDPGPGGWRGILQSRKFWAAIFGFLIMVLDGLHLVLPFDMTPDLLIALAVTIGGYIAGVAVERHRVVISV